MTKDRMAGREVIFELYPVGHIVKVTAMDTRTLTEVTIQAPANVGETVMKKNVLRKLEYVLDKKGLI